MTQAKTGDGRFVLTLNRDGLSCVAVIHAGGANSIPTEIEIRAAMEEQRIDPRSLIEGAIEDLLERAKADPASEHTAEVARGVEPVHGVDGRFELTAELARQFEEIKRRNDLLRDMTDAGHDPGAVEPSDETPDAIDFREVSAFVIVRRGDVIGTVRNPTDGTDGVSVNGQAIPAKKGKSCPVRFGKSVKLIGGEAVAEIDGVLSWRIDHVEISPTLDVRDDVDYETGNIDFPGDVVVSGGVKDHFVVKADGGITIHKLVEASEIVGGAGGVSLRQGMAGRGMGRLDLDGDLDAGYLDGVGGVVRGDLRVQREIKECTIRVEGGIESPECTVQGGRLEASNPSTLGVIGGPGGVATEICVGRLEHYENLAERAEQLARELDLEREKTKAEFESLKKSNKLTASQAERLTELQYVQISHEELAGKIHESCRQMLDVVERAPTTGLTVLRAIYKGTRIQLRNTVFAIREMVQGPIVLEIETDGSIRCEVRGEPTPIGNLAVIEDTGEKTDPVRRLRSITSKAA